MTTILLRASLLQSFVLDAIAHTSEKGDISYEQQPGPTNSLERAFSEHHFRSLIGGQQEDANVHSATQGHNLFELSFSAQGPNFKAQ